MGTADARGAQSVKDKPYIIGLTGNIATGKSTVAAMLARLGAQVIDADKLAHWVMRAGTQVNQRIAERFPGVRKKDGEIDRAKLGALVFADPQALRELEEIVHPQVIAETLRRIESCAKPVLVIEAIKLLETQLHQHCDAIWVVTSSQEQQKERLMRTRHLTAQEAELRIRAQPPQEEKIARADVVIDNSDGLECTWAQVLQAWNAIPGVCPQSPNLPWEEDIERETR
ncbi:MAG: dephospho-CoA kinase [Anaerolineae bacterium]|nr:dephospho-CoA kinase [Anaerolineae bacterium]